MIDDKHYRIDFGNKNFNRTLIENVCFMCLVLKLEMEIFNVSKWFQELSCCPVGSRLADSKLH